MVLRRGFSLAKIHGGVPSVPAPINSLAGESRLHTPDVRQRIRPELLAIAYWNREYLKSDNHTLIEVTAHEHRRKRHRELIVEFLNRRRNATSPQPEWLFELQPSQTLRGRRQMPTPE